MQATRRHFLQTTAAISALSQGRVFGANDRIRLGAIGVGGRCRYLLSRLAQLDGNELVAVCDVYQPRREAARGNAAAECREYADYRELLAQKDIDAVVIGAPDHWHVPMAVDAIAAGKDVYLEKPVTHTIEEGDVLIRAVKSSKQVLQTGTQQRSWPHYQTAREYVTSGKLGTITQIQTFWYQNYNARSGERPKVDLEKLDWKRWLGSAPDQPFDLDRFLTWRWYWDFGGGALTDLFTHWVDVVHWYMGADTPIEAAAMGDRYVLTNWDCPDTISASYRYPHFSVTYNGTMVASLEGGGITIRGTDAMMKLNRERVVVYSENARVAESKYPEPVWEEYSHTDGTIAHLQNFLDCVRSRATPASPVEAGVAAARASHMGNLTLRKKT